MFCLFTLDFFRLKQKQNKMEMFSFCYAYAYIYVKCGPAFTLTRYLNSKETTQVIPSSLLSIPYLNTMNRSGDLLSFYADGNFDDLVSQHLSVTAIFFVFELLFLEKIIILYDVMLLQKKDNSNNLSYFLISE